MENNKEFSGKRKIVIAETSTSNFNYHLREIVEGEGKYGGGAGAALCGKALGWDTKQPLRSYGMKSHIPSSYCEECRKLAEPLGYEVGHKNDHES